MDITMDQNLEILSERLKITEKVAKRLGVSFDYCICKASPNGGKQWWVS